MTSFDDRELDGYEDAIALRIIDANGNRAVEGLRVTEEYLRFGAEDVFLAARCKGIRHKVSTTLAAIPRERRLACRSTETDVGTSTQTDQEYDRPDLRSVAIANVRRATEALRALEEYAKLISKSCACEFEAARYETYTLEKAVSHMLRSRDALDDALLYVLVDLQFGAGEEFEARLRQLLSAGVDVIQLRDKTATDRELVEAAQIVRRLTSDGESLFVVNDRPDIARVVGADGVHVGQDELGVAEVRRVVGPELLIGVSTHSLSQAQTAVLDGADYIGVGPVFSSKTKDFEQFVGVDLVQQVAGEIGLPAYAIGGISEDNVSQVLDAGGSRVAVSSAIWNAEDPAAAARVLRRELVEVVAHRQG